MFKPLVVRSSSARCRQGKMMSLPDTNHSTAHKMGSIIRPAAASSYIREKIKSLPAQTSSLVA
ncbi:MAG: hypothetical protein CM15mP103_12200 [Gammaproteobacteria bacterium]|nr:MAG: hypothetical protein CM15mP103_12200 [Gammaproteobacteria bacterium]